MEYINKMIEIENVCMQDCNPTSMPGDPQMPLEKKRASLEATPIESL